MSEWISVNDRLPDNNYSVLIFNSNEKIIGMGEFFINGYKDHKKPCWSYYTSPLNKKIEEVTHWQSLPEPPK